MKTTEQVTKRPFHETIVDAIERADDPQKLALLASLVNETKIPANHDAISAAWTEKRKKFGLGDIYEKEIFGVEASLERQKQEAFEKEKAKASKEQAGAVSP